MPPPEGDAPAADTEPVDWTLRVTTPSSSDLLAGNRIAVATGEHRMSTFAGARWVSPLPRLWQEHLIETFYADGRIHRLSADGERLSADLELRTTLRAFQIETRDEGPRARVVVDARLVDVGQRRIVATERFAATRDVASDDTDAAVAALGAANRSVGRELVAWTVTAAAED
nr:ABC-type transport auxiliary lipoprotein family protein [Halorhodospira halophila]